MYLMPGIGGFNASHSSSSLIMIMLMIYMIMIMTVTVTVTVIMKMKMKIEKITRDLSRSLPFVMDLYSTKYLY